VIAPAKGAHGYGIIVDPSLSRPTEFDTVQCKHCGGHVRVKPGTGYTVYLIPTDTPGVDREEPGCWCGRCSGPICLTCYRRFPGRCRPFELWLDVQEQRIRNRLGWGRFFRFIGID
jgi:hypothetical protein